MRKIILLGLTLFATLFFTGNKGFAQCPLTGNIAGSVTPGCNGFGATLQTPSTSYATFNAIQGVNYTISTCGTTWDTQITGYDASNNQITSGQTAPVSGGGFYRDDNGTDCSGLQASLNWTATYTGGVKVMVHRYDCGFLGGIPAWETTSAVLKIRQNTTITNTTQTNAMCGDGSQKPLTVSYTANNNAIYNTSHSGSPAVTWTIVLGHGSITGSTYTASGVSGNSETVIIRATLGACSSDVAFTVWNIPTTANAGANQTVCNSDFTLAGNTPTIGSGTWSVINGSANIANPSSPTSGVSVPVGTSATLRWTITNGLCSSFSDVVLTNNQPAQADAGGIPPDVVCQSASPTAITLSGASVGGSATTGAWSILSGGGTLSSLGQTANPSAVTYTPAANFSGTVTLRLQTNDPVGPCLAVTSQRTIVVNPAATATAAGPDAACQSSSPTAITLSGASVGGSASTGAWSILSGGGTLSSTAQTATPATVTYTPAANFAGTAVLQLTTNDPDGAGPCTVTTSTRNVVIDSVAVADAGGPDAACASATPSAITLSGASVGGSATTGAWSILSGGGSLSNFAQTGNPSAVTYTPAPNFTGTVTLQLITDDPAGPCSAASSIRTIEVGPQPTVEAGGSDAVCRSATPTAITLTGASFGGSATAAAWSIISGGGTLSDTSPTADPSAVTYTPAPNFSGTVTLQLTTDAPAGCVAATDTRTITVHALPALAPTNNSPVCAGGQIDLNPNASGGLPGYSFNWSGPSYASASPAPSITNATPAMSGTYNVTVTDQNLCSASGSTSVTVNPLPNGSIGSSVTVCAGTADTVLTFNFPTGTAPFDIIYTDGSNSYPRTGVNSGDTIHIAVGGSGTTTTYSFTEIEDANGCIRTSGFAGSATVTVAPLPVITTVNVTNVLCNGTATGAISINATSGTPAYTYSIDNGGSFQSSNSFNGLLAGNSYNLVVADALGCSSPYVSNPVTITEPPVLDHTYTTENASCESVLDGKITVTASGGTFPYNYSLNGGPAQTGNELSGLASGVYVLQVADFNGCTDTSHILIDTTYAVFGSVVSQTDVSCFGGLDGTVTLELIGGIPDYSYSINGLIFQTSPVFTGLASGNYVATLRDSKGCTVYESVTIAQPNILQTIVDSVEDILCNGGNSGAIYITVIGGNGGYSYAWSNGDTTEDISNLTAGTYNVAVLDAKGCFASAGATISQPLPLFLSVASFENLNCFNDSSGSIDITVNGGVPPYSFAWSNGATNEDILQISADTYSVTVTDANNCMDSLTQVVTEPTQLTSTISSTNVQCAGGTDGNVDLTVSGGTSTYSYLWSNGATTEDLTNVGGGIYSVVIYDANGCSTTNITTVVAPQVLNISVSVTNVLCHDSLTGEIDLTVSGGAGTLTFAWNNLETTEDITGLAAGNYSVTVTDDNSCSASAAATITQPAGIIVNATTTTGCAGGANGSIDITVQGGVFPYSFEWSNGETTEDVNNLSGGTYTVTITDDNGCSVEETYNIGVTTPIISSVAGTDVTCFGASDGSADLTVSGGNAPYTFLWSTFQNTEDISGLSGGIYYVIISDASGCQSRDSVIINEAPAIILSTFVTNVLCHDSLTGEIDLTVSGGAGTLTFAWNNLETTEDITGLAAGNYSVTVTDDNSCSASAAATISQSTPIAISASIANAQCAGGNNGSIYLSVVGGTPLYTFAWSNSETTQNILNLTAGTYDVTVVDASGCSTTASYTVTAPATNITSTVTSTNVLCYGSNTGTASVLASGGSTPYTYFWSTFEATPTISGLHGGIYYVIITDANGCTQRDSAIVTEPSQLFISATPTGITCNNANDGSIDITVSGGTPAYSYLWNNNDTTEDRSLLAGGQYSVTVTDQNSCSISASAVIVNPSALQANTIVQRPLCYGNTNGSINLIPSGGTLNYSFLWSTNDSTEDILGIGAGTYSFTITDAHGCIKTDSIVLTEPNPLFVTENRKHVTCFGDNDGAITLTVYGGTLPYDYSWSTSSFTKDILNLSGGTYSVTVSDANGCFVPQTYTINEAAPVTDSIIVLSNVSCFGGSNGAVAIVPAGGVTPYTYLWNDNFTADSLRTGIPAGFYSVVVSDSNGCSAANAVTVTQPTAISITSIITDALCFGSLTGAIDITVSGGTPGYTYLWTGGITTEDRINITAGVYSITVTDSNNCVMIDSFEVGESNRLSLSVSSSNPVCYGGNTGFILADATGGVTPFSYTWSSAHSGSTATNLTAGTYTVTVADVNNCSATASAVLQNPAPITVTTNAETLKCFNSTAGVTATVTGGTLPYSYVLNGVAEDTGVFVNLPAGEHLLLVIDVNGCQGKSSFTINNVQPFSVDVAARQQVILTGMETQLVVTTDTGVSILHYSWLPDTLFGATSCTDCSDPYVAPRTTTIFTVTVINSDSCYASDTITIYVNNEPSKFIPTAFTPNGDQLNDYFEFDVLGAENLEVSIFNRWGERVYYNPSQPNGIGGQNGWDGTVNGKPAPFDTYIYQIRVTYWDNVSKDVTGTVTLMK